MGDINYQKRILDAMIEIRKRSKIKDWPLKECKFPLIPEYQRDVEKYVMEIEEEHKQAGKKPGSRDIIFGYRHCFA